MLSWLVREGVPHSGVQTVAGPQTTPCCCDSGLLWDSARAPSVRPWAVVSSPVLAHALAGPVEDFLYLHLLGLVTGEV